MSLVLLMFQVPVTGEAMTPVSPPPSDWYQPRPPPCLPQRGGGPGGVAEPHYSVPRNNSRVSHVSCHHGHMDSETHAGQRNVIVTGVQHHRDPGHNHTSNGQDHDQSHHGRPEPELDKTPTNEAGRMLDLIEKVVILFVKKCVYRMDDTLKFFRLFSNIGKDKWLK